MPIGLPLQGPRRPQAHHGGEESERPDQRLRRKSAHGGCSGDGREAARHPQAPRRSSVVPVGEDSLWNAQPGRWEAKDAGQGG